MARLLAETRTNQARTDSKPRQGGRESKEMNEDIKTKQTKSDANLRTIKDKMRTGQELLKEQMLAKLVAHYKRTMARDSQIK
jgi:hypothetical protein